MRATTWVERTDIQLRGLTPFAFTLLMVLASALPWHLPSFAPVTQVILNSQRTFFHGKPFLVVWWGFSLVMPGIALVSWIIASLYFNALVPSMPFVIQAVLTILLYPLFAVLLSALHRHMMRGT